MSVKTTSIAEISFLNHHMPAHTWQIHQAAEIGDVISSEHMSSNQRERVKATVAKCLPSLRVYEDSQNGSIVFDRNNLIALLQKEKVDADMATQGPTDPVENIIQKRASGYQFDPDAIPTEAHLTKIFNAARRAPSAYHEQPWRFILCSRETDKDAYDKLFHLLGEEQKRWIINAPVLVIVVSAVRPVTEAPLGGPKGAPNPWALYDTGAAAVCMMLQATSLGLMAHQVGGFDPKKVSQTFKIAEGFDPIAVMAIGYNGESLAKDKPRKTLEEIVFRGEWKKGS